MNAETAQILERIPVDLLTAYHDAWGKYQTACIMNRGSETCATAYADARIMEDKLQAAIKEASAEIRREKAEAVR